MRDAMVLDAPRTAAARRGRARPRAGPGELLLRVRACGVCRTDLHIADGEVERAAAAAGARPPGRRRARADTGRARRRPVAGLDVRRRAASAARAREPLRARALHGPGRRRRLSPSGASPTSASASRCPTAYGDLDGGAAAVRRADRPPRAADDAATPRRLGLYGFGAAAHIVCQVARHEGRRVFAFTRAGDDARAALRARARRDWAGDALGAPPEPLDAAIIFAPAGELVAGGAARASTAAASSSAPGST